jgi:RimJ/RimL family protein N-acetyltransferase
MRDMSTPLFEGERVRLAPRDPERDAEIESGWTHDPEYLQLMDSRPALPISPGQVRRQYEAEEKERDRILFGIHTRAENRLVGTVGLKWIQWSHGVAVLSIGIGTAADRRQGYGKEALRLFLNYAFNELNLYRVTAMTFEYNPVAVHMLEQAGFVLEARRRQAVYRTGRRWDALLLGLLRTEWEKTS